jgi:hypothetical protein
LEVRKLGKLVEGFNTLDDGTSILAEDGLCRSSDAKTSLGAEVKLLQRSRSGLLVNLMGEVGSLCELIG